MSTQQQQQQDQPTTDKSVTIEAVALESVAAAPTATDTMDQDLCVPFHPEVSFPASKPYGAPLPSAPDELTLRMLQYLQACWDAGRPARREAAVAAGVFETDFEHSDTASTAVKTAIPQPPHSTFVDIAASSGGSVMALVKHSFVELACHGGSDVCAAYSSFLPQDQQEKYSPAAFEQVGLHVRQFDRPSDAEVHRTWRETAFLHNPYAPEDLAARAAAQSPDAAAQLATPSNAQLHSPMKKRLADIYSSAASSVSTPPPTGRSHRNGARDPFAVARSVDVRRNWDTLKLPCGFKCLSRSAIDSHALWGLSEQGTPYASVRVPLSDPPTQEWVRVSSGHLDTESIAGKVSHKVHVSSLAVISCGHSRAVWGVTQCSLDSGRCVARVGFTDDTPVGTDWVNVSEGLVPPPPSANDRALALMAKRSSNAAMSVAAQSTKPRKRFVDVSVGADGSVWAIVAESLPPSHAPVTSVWVRSGARDDCLGTHWVPLAISQEPLVFQRPHSASRLPRQHQFLKLSHVWYNRVLAIIAETPASYDVGYGSIYERCGIVGRTSTSDIRGTCWRKIIVDPSPLCNALRVPVALTATHDLGPAAAAAVVFGKCTLGTDGNCWAIDQKGRLRDLSATLQRAQCFPSSIIIHDTFPLADQLRDANLDGDLVNGTRTNLKPVIERFLNREETSQPLSLSLNERRELWSQACMLDMPSLKALFGDFDGAAWDVDQAVCFLTHVEEVPIHRGGDSDGEHGGEEGGNHAHEYLLLFSWHVYPDVQPLNVVIRAVPHATLDPQLLLQVVHVVPLTVKIAWVTPGPAALQSLRDAPSMAGPSGVNRSFYGGGLQILHQVAGADFIKQLNEAFPTIQPSVCHWLQLDNLTSAVSNAGALERGLVYESVVHRDIVPEENYLDALGLYHPSLRKLRCLQVSQRQMATKMMLMGCSRHVTVVSHVSMGSPAASVAMYCSDVQQGGPLASLFAFTEHHGRQHADCEALYGGLLSCLQTLPSAEPHYFRSIHHQADSLTRLFVDLVDMVDAACAAHQVAVYAVALANDDMTVFPASSVSPSLPFEVAAHATALLHPGLTLLLRTSMGSLLQYAMPCGAPNHGANAASSFARLISLLMSAPSREVAQLSSDVSGASTNNSLGGGDDDANIILSVNVTQAIVRAQKSCQEYNAVNGVQRGLGSTPRRMVWEAASSYLGMDLLSPIAQRQEDPTVAMSLSRVLCVLLDPVLQVEWEQQQHQSATPSLMDTRASMPNDVRLSATLVVDTSMVLDADDWSRDLPPSFRATGSIALAPGRLDSAGSFLVFKGVTDIAHWCYPINALHQAVFSQLTVEAVLCESSPTPSISASSPTQLLTSGALISKWELVELRLSGAATAQGMLFDNATVAFPVRSREISPTLAADLFGPSILHIHRHSLTGGELVRSVRSAHVYAMESGGLPQRPINAASAEAITRTEAMLDHCVVMRQFAACVATCDMPMSAIPSSIGARSVPLQRSSPSVVTRCVSAHTDDLNDSVVRSGDHITLTAQQQDSASAAYCVVSLTTCRDCDNSSEGEPPVCDVIVGPCCCRMPSTWLLRKVLPDGLQQPPSTHHPDPILRHGDIVTVHPTACPPGSALAAASRSLIHLLTTRWRVELLSNTPLSERNLVTPFEPLKAQQLFQLVDANSDAPLVMDGHGVFAAVPAVTASSLQADRVPCTVFGQRGLASVQADLSLRTMGHAPAWISDRNNGVVVLCQVDGAFTMPITPGHRGRSAAISIADRRSSDAGCAWQMTLSKRSPSDGSSSTEPTYSVGFHLRDAVISVLGLEVACTASGLSDGVTGVPLRDCVLHAVGRGVVPVQQVGAPPPPPVIAEMHETCDGLPFRVALEVPLRSASVLQNPPASSAHYPLPAEDSNSQRFSYDLSFASPRLEAVLDCPECVNKVELWVRNMMRRKASSVVEHEVIKCNEWRLAIDNAQRQADELEAEHALLRNTYESEPLQEKREAQSEVLQAVSSLKKIIQSQEDFSEKCARKPYKADFYRVTTGAALSEARFQQVNQLRRLQSIAANKVQAADDNLIQLSQIVSRIAQEEQAAHVLRSMVRKSEATQAVLQSQLPVDERVLWAITSVRLVVTGDPSSAVQPSAACVELTCAVYPHSSGQLSVHQRLWKLPSTSLDTLAPFAASGVSGADEHEGSDRAALHQRQKKIFDDGTQMFEEKVLLLPLHTDPKAALPLRSMKDFVEHIVEPACRKVLLEIIADDCFSGTSGVASEIVQQLCTV